jgi:small subunit ribosomal protein S6
MKNYELLYIIKGEVGEENVDAIIAKVEKIVTDNGGSVEKSEKWGLKKFAYPIDYKTEGFYVLMNFASEPAFPAELDRNLRISDEIVRGMIVSK